MLLAGDIGGTKTALGVFSEEQGPHKALAEAEVHSADYPSLEAIAQEFLAKAAVRVDSACFGIAGPVLAGRAKVTNLPWIVDQAAMAKALNLRAVHLLNDLEAIAWAVPELRPEDVDTLSAGEPVARGNIAVIAPGTGLGEAFLTWENGEYRAHSSEGGHSDFAPADETQMRLLAFMRERLDHVSYEHVCSGVGIPYIYDFFRDREKIAEKPETAERITSASDRTKAIIQLALDPADPSPCCVAAIETVVSIMGAEAGNLALKVLAVGGVYLGGGIPVHIVPILKSPRFLESFRRKGRFAQMMSRIAVHLMISKVGIAGAAAYGLRMAPKDSVDPVRPTNADRLVSA
jgi:glucokinase